MTTFRRRHRKLHLILAYLLLLAASQLFRHFRSETTEISDTISVFSAKAVRGGQRSPANLVRMAYLDTGPAEQATEGPPVLLLHGSPGSLEDFRELARLLARRHRVIAPSLPGFGISQHHIPDYSTRAHADYCLQLLDFLKLPRVHVVAFSMGGGVALDLYDRDPGRVASMAMIGSIGVQELELLGNYELNHIIHGIQVAALWALENLTPHFGLFDNDIFSTAYARNFYDTDQRSFRNILLRFEPPVLIIHSRDDSLVPFAAGEEHHRLLPQSEMVAFDSGNHFILWTKPSLIAHDLDTFFEEVESGTAPTRDQATPERIAAAMRPFSRIPIEPARGLSLFILLALIVTGTFITEDLTCIAAGLLIAHGRLPLTAGFLACFLGIYLGDQLLYLAGRVLGRSAVHRAPWKWVVNEEDLRVAASWFERRGMMVILLSRFVPGTRLPTYLLAGAVRARYWLFALYFFVAVALWTPLILGLTLIVGERAAPLWSRVEHNAFWVLILTFVTVLIFLRLIVPSFTHRGRRILVGHWRRLIRWEFWPPWAFYPPVVLRILGWSLRKGGFARVTAVNPGIHLGGFVGESKWEIYRGLSASEDHLAITTLLPRRFTVAQALGHARHFLSEKKLDYPLILKPDRGQRGEHVYKLHNEDELEHRLRQLRRPEDERHEAIKDFLLQEYVEGPEYGIYYRRFPTEKHGEVVSITEKRLPAVIGDGKRRLEQLILDDPRAVCMARAYMAQLADRLFEIPAPGEEIRLVEIGTHSRGAIFLDGSRLITDAIRARFDVIARRFEGFYFGRFDIRATSEEALREGKDFKILELNGLTGEATHFYDPRYSVLDAWRVLIQQWKDAFAIADANIAAGATAVSNRAVIREVLRFLGGTLG